MKQDGFSLVELVVVMSCSGILGLFALSSMQHLGKLNATSLGRSDFFTTKKILNSALSNIDKDNYLSYISPAESDIINCFVNKNCASIVEMGKPSNGFLPFSLKISTISRDVVYSPTSLSAIGAICPDGISPACPFAVKTQLKPICLAVAANTCAETVGLTIEMAIERHFSEKGKKLERSTHEVMRKNIFFANRLTGAGTIARPTARPVPPAPQTSCDPPDVDAPKYPLTGCFDSATTCETYLKKNNKKCTFPKARCENWSSVSGLTSSITATPIPVVIGNPTATVKPVASKFKKATVCWAVFYD